jgi:hypothetical protein
MISAHVRRLALDPNPLLQSRIGVLLWLVVGFIAALWMTGKGAPNFMIVLSASAITLNFAVKMPVWKTLPVSRSDLARAQWGYLWGRPYAMVIIVTAGAAAVDALFGWLRVPSTDGLAFLGGELILLCLVAVSQPLTALLAPWLGAPGAVLGFGVPFAVVLALGFRWTLDHGPAADRPEMLAGGLIAIAIALAAYGLSPWMPLAEPRFPGARKTETDKKGAVARPAAERLAARPPRRAGGYAVVGALLGRAAWIVPLLTVTAVAGGVWDLSGPWGAGLPLEHVSMLLPMLGGIWAVGLVSSTSQRVLAGLPLGALARTAALQSVGFALQVPAAMLVIGLVALTRPHAPSTDWFLELGLSMLGATAFAAAGLPAALRFGRMAPVLLAVTMTVAGVAAGILAGLNSRTGSLAGITADQWRSMAAGAGLALLLAGWIWTWLEIAYGRAAYRQWTWGVVRWRGA